MNQGFTINQEFIKSTLLEMEYHLKEGTKASYYWHEGARILPNRLSISKSEITKVERKGRNLLHSISGQMIGSFKKSEDSPLKRNKPYTCRTQIWRVEEYPHFIGYGTIGITNSEGGIFDTNDLVIFDSKDNWQTIRIYFFRGLGHVDNLLPCMKFLNDKIRSEQALKTCSQKGY